MPRLFVAVWPPSGVVERLEALPRADDAGVRWTTAAQWHVTVRYLGEVDEQAAEAALGRVVAGPTEAVLGPRVERLGAGVVAVPVSGLDALAAAVLDETRSMGEPPHPEGFRAHLTLARLRAGGRCGLDGAAIEGRFVVDEISLVRSELHPDGARYATVTRHRLSA